MDKNLPQEQLILEIEPRWPAALALLAVGGLNVALPVDLALFPTWYLLFFIAILLVPTLVAHRKGRHHLNQALGYLISGIITVAMIGSLILLVRALPTQRETPGQLLRSAAALWVTNILVFALWYWRLDAGGPNRRDKQYEHTNGAFLFPQMTMTKQAKKEAGLQSWSPNFVDYLFVAFNTSTALSPTDVPVLSRWAKLLMMVQATISLAIVVLLAARAVNILGS